MQQTIQTSGTATTRTFKLCEMLEDAFGIIRIFKWRNKINKQQTSNQQYRDEELE